MWGRFVPIIVAVAPAPWLKLSPVKSSLNFVTRSKSFFRLGLDLLCGVLVLPLQVGMFWWFTSRFGRVVDSISGLESRTGLAGIAGGFFVDAKICLKSSNSRCRIPKWWDEGSDEFRRWRSSWIVISSSLESSSGLNIDWFKTDWPTADLLFGGLTEMSSGLLFWINTLLSSLIGLSR